MTIDDKALIAELEQAQEWMREPDHAESFSRDDLINWLNNRPTSVMLRAAARLRAATSPSPALPADDAGLVERFLNPDDALLAAYWLYSPRPIEIDQENADAARTHLANLVRAASQPAGGEGE